MEITSKLITKGEECPTYETRYFGETEDKFDGTAQGYGYKSKEKLMKAYWFFQNKDKIKANQGNAKKFLKENSEIKKLINDYFSEENYVWAFKDGEELTMNSFLESLKEEGKTEVIKLLNENKRLWREFLK